MALFQPTNIIPSSLIGQGTVDVNDNMEISWQVNGNSAMIAFQIDFYMNDAASTYVTTTGKLPASGETQAQYGLPFYGTDRFGNPQFFTWSANKTWSAWSALQFTNGNEYKFKIIQWFNATNNVVSCQPSSAQTSGTQYYFTVNNGTYQGAVVSFTAPSNIAAGATFYYSFTNGECWVESGNRTIVLNGNMSASGDIPNGATELLGQIATTTLDYMFVAQNSASIFVTRATPTLTINQTDENYLNPIALPSTLSTSIGYFQAAYNQVQDDAIRWIRWQVAQANNNAIGEILADTGDIYTPTLNFEFNGFFNGQQYAIRCFGESESGQACDTGWQYFNIMLNNQAEYTGNFTAQCLNKENASLLKWEGVAVISPTVSPEDYSPTILNGSVTLNGQLDDTEYSVAWNKNGESPMNFTAPWTAAWKGKIQDPLPQIIGFSQEQTLSNLVGYLIRYSPDGNYLVVYNTTQNLQMIVYSAATTGVELKGYLRSSGAITTAPTQYDERVVNDIAFSPNGNLFAVSTANSLLLYQYSNGNFILLDSTPTSTRGYSIAFSPDSKLLVRSGVNSQPARVYSVANNTLTELYWLTMAGANIVDFLSAIDFSGDGKWMCLCGNEIGSIIGAYLFSVNGEQISFYQQLPINEGCWNLAFNKNSSNPTMLIVAGKSQYYHFAIRDGNVSLQANLTDVGNVYQGISRSIAFSADGNNLLIGGTGYVNWYKINGNNIDFNSKIILNDDVSWTNAIAIDWNPQNNQIAIENNQNTSTNGDAVFLFAPQYSNPIYSPQGKLFVLALGENNEITISRQDNPIIIQLNEATLVSFSVPKNTTETAVVITPSLAVAYFYSNGELLSSTQHAVTYTQQAITSVSIYGGNKGATIDSVSVYDNREKQFDITNYDNPDFEPVWNDENYSLYMTANFNGNLEGGTGTASGNGFRVYRQEVGTTILIPIATVPSTTTSLKDYGIVSDKAYQYLLYAYDNNGAFMSAVKAENTIATNFKNYSLLVCDYDQTNDEYHIRKQYLFALNLTDGSVGNNNSPTLSKNFTPFPTRMGDTANYKSGTLSGLIGAIYTIPALIEQIGQYKYTAKPSTMDYFDSVDLEKELYDLSVAPYQLFLRDMKGRLRMIATSAPITMTTNLKQRQQSITISLPWVEVGDASDVTIIQTPDDYGWNNDNQGLDVQLDVDIATGELSAQYPFPYNGTKFYLTGVNKETLTAKTPLGITPAQFELSDTAQNTDDGELTATVNVNSEDNQ